jgi:hypothetical protein
MVDFSATIDGSGGFLYAGLGVNRALSTTIAGQSSMNSTFIEALMEATSTFTAGLTVHPFFEVRDSGDLLVSGVDYESIYAGISTVPQVLTFINHSDTQIDVTLTPKASLTPQGAALDTYESQYLSLDGINYNKVLLLEIPAYDTLDCYFKYFPSSNSKIGEKQWEVSQRDESLSGAVLLNGWFYAKAYTITGGTGALTNARVLLRMDYVAGDMKEDFSDIRFTLTNGTSLDYEIAYKLDGDECYFIVTIPSLPANPSTTNVYAYSGNFTVPTTADTLTETVYDWTDGTLDPWVAELNGWPSYYYGAHASVSSSLLLLSANYANWRGIAYTPNIQAYGSWQFTFNGYDSTGKLYLYFIKNSGSSYAVTINKTNGSTTATIQLEENDTALTSTTATINSTGEYVINVLRDSSGLMNVYLDNILILTATDTTITTSENIRLESWAVAAAPDAQNFYVKSVETSTTDLTGTITESSWTFYVAIECRAGILYKSQEIEGIEPEIRHGCRIGGVYYE